MRNKSFRQKILLLLSAGTALGFSYTPSRQHRILKNLGKAWQRINLEDLKKDL